MKRSKKFEKRTHAIGLAQLKSSPRNWKIYQRQQPSWRYKLLMACVALGAIAGTGMVLIGLPFRGGMELARARDEVLVMAYACLLTTCGVAVALMHGSWLIAELLASRGVAMAAYLPVADSSYVAHKSSRMLLSMCLMLLPCFSFFAGIASGLPRPFQGHQVATVFGMAAVEWVIVVALIFNITGWFPRFASPGAVGKILSYGALCFPTAWFAKNLIDIGTTAKIVMAIVPTGWPFLMLHYGLSGQEPRAWLLLVGVLVLIGTGWLGYRRMLRHYVVAEFSFSENATATVVFAPEVQANFETELSTVFDQEDDVLEDASVDELHESPRRIPVIQRFVNWITFTQETESRGEVSADEARRIIRSRAFLAPREWQGDGWIERNCARIYGPREVWLVELLTGGFPRWSSRLGVLLVQCLCALAVLFGIAKFFGPSLLGLSGHILLATMFGLMKGSWPAALWKSKAGQVASITSLLPVRPSELNRVQMVLGVMRGLCLLPVAFILAALGLYGVMGRLNLVFAARLAVKSILITVALHQWWGMIFLPHAMSRPLWRLLLNVPVLVLLIVLFLVGAIGLFVAGDSEPWSVVASIGLLGSGWIFNAWVQRRILYGPSDFFRTARTDHMRVTQEQGTMKANW